MEKKDKTKKKSGASLKKEFSLIEKSFLKFLQLMGFKNSKLEFENIEKGIKININNSELEALAKDNQDLVANLQLILSLIHYNQTGTWQRLIINIGDWLEKRTAELERLALNTAQKVKFSGEEAIMPYLNSYERRIVHLALKDNPDVKTESTGEGKDRRLLVKSKN